MKSIAELRSALRLNPQEINSSVKYFAEKVIIDFDVYLPSRMMNLQRPFVWTLDQKRELIWSILIGRHIPRMAMINIMKDPDDVNGYYQVIDGKQRLSAMLDFYNGKYSLEVDGQEYFFKDLPEDYQRVISRYNFPYYIVNESSSGYITDEDKIQWFKFLNFAGTLQEEAHMWNLINSK